MEPLDQSSQDITSLLSLGVDYEKELQDMNAAVLSPTEEFKEEEEDAQSEPEQGTAAAGEESKLAGAQGGEEKDGGGGGGAGAPGLLWKENREGSSGSDGDDEDSDQSEKEPRQQDSPPPGAVGGLEPGNAQEPSVHAFTPLQLQELERIFQRKKYPSEFLRRRLARSMNVTELAVQIWFENRRAKWRRHQRALMARNMPPLMVVGQPVMVTAVEAIMAPLSISRMRDGYFWGYSHPSTLCFSMSPFPPPSLPLPTVLFPPMPPSDEAQFGRFPFVIGHSFTFPNV
ncbi:rhox homeobox family member 2 [Macaca thibetana thibetana]|uniref:RHOXF2 protein n=3 Tax=Macaca TaxID=9539 RepID=G9BBT4_MACAS|nr:rhox homeobox family member 2 [Macaca thibetana thibetana]AEO14131.1 RHOXF2 protein [Macaca arctoides]AEO14132.1 RHOXF2 protein [Macaca thibetana]AEO14133.1 RHOXF2 protein [Macaca assamensis]